MIPIMGGRREARDKDAHMRIAANYSGHLMRLMERRSGIVVKVSDWGSIAAVEAVLARHSDAAFLVHLTLVIGSGATVDRSGKIWEDLKVLVPLTKTPHLSAHIGYNCQVDYAPDGRYVFGRRLPDETLMENMRCNAGLLQDAFGLPLILENQTAVYGGPFIPPFMEGCSSASFINRALETTGCDMLLDLAHARVNAAFHKMTIEDYLAALPLETVREMHLSGCRVIKDGLLSDEHLELEETDYDLLRLTLKRCRPGALTLEYDKDFELLERQIERLEAIAEKEP